MKQEETNKTISWFDAFGSAQLSSAQHATCLDYSTIPYVRRSKHGIDSIVISLGGITQGPLSLHTVGAHSC